MDNFRNVLLEYENENSNDTITYDSEVWDLPEDLYNDLRFIDDIISGNGVSQQPGDNPKTPAEVEAGSRKRGIFTEHQLLLIVQMAARRVARQAALRAARRAAQRAARRKNMPQAG